MTKFEPTPVWALVTDDGLADPDNVDAIPVYSSVERASIEAAYEPGHTTAEAVLVPMEVWERLKDTAENVLIAYGMGWDMGGVMSALKNSLPTTKEPTDD